MAAATQWLFNFAITYMTPSAINNIKWKTFLMFGIFSLANAAFAFFFVKETKGRTLEDMDLIFGTVAAEQRAADVEAIVHKHAIHGDDEHIEMATDAKHANTNELPADVQPPAELAEKNVH